MRINFLCWFGLHKMKIILAEDGISEKKVCKRCGRSRRFLIW